MKYPFLVTLCSTAGLAATIAQINGNKFLSPYAGKAVRGVTGLVTAKSSAGFWIRSTTPDNDVRTSESLYIRSNTTTATIGDVISLDGQISSYRSSSSYLYLTQLTNPTSVKTVSTGNQVTPLVLGSNSSLSPPTAQYTSLDKGDVLGLPNNVSLVSVSNPVLEPSKYGLDFWQSLTGELVTIKNPVAISKSSSYGETWVVGDWSVTGRNGRGGLTLTAGDGNPEAILIGSSLDGTKNPVTVVLGDKLEDITGVITYAFGEYRVLPQTAFKISTSPSPALPPAAPFRSTSKCSGITLADYNIENFSFNSSNLAGRADHIVNYLNTPDLVFLQEIQDNDGPTNDGVVSANKTLDLLVGAISAISPIKYSYIDIDPVNDKDGGQPGGNIRQAYLYNPAILGLTYTNPGSATDDTQVLSGPKLSHNPGRIAPSSPVWSSSRKPLVAQWTVASDSSTFFTVNVHFTAKLGSSPTEGDARPPVNGGVNQRLQQANVTASFVADILAEDPNAAVILAGDCNEFSFAQPLKELMVESGLVDLDDAAGVAAVERYTYLFDMNAQELDHFFVSKKVAGRSPRVEHVHVNTWASAADQVSDHDPSVALINVCA